MPETSSDKNRNLPATGSGAMFDNLAPRYDLLNRLMSLGVDKRWRRRTVRSLQLRSGDKVLDLATGTGDLAINIARKHTDVTVVGVDPSAGMLDVGRTKIAKAGLSERITMREGVGEELPFENDTFNAVTIAFGIRNCTDRPQALREMRRVTKAGGRIGILELGEPRRGIMAPIARFHIHQLIPRLGAWLSGAREYRYLQESIEAFPPSEEFAVTMGDCGLHILDLVPFGFGSCHLYLAEVPKDEGDLAN
ncbi:MAG: bifunctional demethylmenaquinone methyltransferase/2-methoxy-6-polyprenyl-1,4-benzoquinol methylase UbiE [Myxococcales bacterium]|nr:bifunctional demethylmenaquinone methyltransferase/2-methoxy-6-polyprenyl-1,4-benzoquinol methylase UbiE [Myxococcales bacterium]